MSGSEKLNSAAASRAAWSLWPLLWNASRPSASCCSSDSSAQCHQSEFRGLLRFLAAGANQLQGINGCVFSCGVAVPLHLPCLDGGQVVELLTAGFTR